MSKLEMILMPEEYIICRLPVESAGANIWLPAEGFWSLTRTLDEVSLVMAVDNAVPMNAQVESGWRMLRVAGTLDFALTGILAGLSSILARAGVSIFALSTFDTDYLLIRQQQLDTAMHALTAAAIHVMPFDEDEVPAATVSSKR
ncbi:MAG: ACT domain-containing protein [Anaerolineae bacterium]|nr:ACT domain-containing protein [Anaerolineae bacterium]